MPSGTQEVSRGLLQQWKLVGPDPVEIDARGRPVRRKCDVVPVQVAFIDQVLKIDQKLVACECGPCGVRAVAVSGGTERKDLPERGTLSGGRGFHCSALLLSPSNHSFGPASVSPSMNENGTSGTFDTLRPARSSNIVLAASRPFSYPGWLMVVRRRGNL